MSRSRHTFQIKLMVRSPFLFRGLAGQLVGVDSSQLRNERDEPIIPSDQVRGVLREALELLAGGSAAVSTKDVEQLFGQKSADEDQDGTANEPARGLLIFSDLVARQMLVDPEDSKSSFVPVHKSSKETTRISIDDETGAAADGMLQVIEIVSDFGAGVLFEGELVAFLPDAEAKVLEGKLKKALALVVSIGAFKSSGFGEIVQRLSSVDLRASQPLLPASVKAPAGPRRYRVTFDRPILVDSGKVADNAFVGSSVIPGAVFKGALAQRLELAGLPPHQGELGSALTQLSFSHGFPMAADGHGVEVPIPLSMVAAKVKGNSGKDTTLFSDVVAHSNMGQLLAGETPLFPGDWKPSWNDAARKLLGYPDFATPRTLARTHTEIDTARGTAQDRNLFTTLARASLNDKGQPNQWRLDVRPGVGEEKQFALLLSVLEQGLDGIGKTGASAKLEPIDGPSESMPRHIFNHSNRYAVVLQTSALLIDAADWIDEAGAWSDMPVAAYRSYWQHVLPSAKLIDCITSQQWAGGYLSRRRRAYGSKTYYPFLLTTPGSVFVVETTDSEALAKLLRTRLPVVGRKSRPPFVWTNCPYLPENGYGEIQANHLSDQAVFSQLKALSDA